MNVVLSAVGAAVIFAVLLVGITYITIPNGIVPSWSTNGERISFPYTFNVDKPSWMEIDAVLKGKGKVFLVLPRMGLSNIEVFLNGKMIWQVGDEDHHSRMWTQTFVVPLDLTGGNSKLSIKSFVLYDVKINWPPYLSKSPWMKMFLSNLFFSEFPTMFFGMAIVLGILMMRISYQTLDPTGNFLFGISLIIAGLFILDYSYIGLFLNRRLYLFMRRIGYSLPYLSVTSYFYSVRRVVIKKITPLKIVVPMIAVSILPIIIHDFKIARMIAFLLSPLIVILIIGMLIEIILERKYEFVSPFTFLFLSASYSTILVWKFPNPGVLTFGVSCSIVAVIKHLYSEYKNLTVTAILARKKSLLDPLTGAFNRRVFNEIPPSFRGTLIFIDLDGFKTFNDTYGHEKGDEILRRFADIVMKRLRKDDIFIRYGGDEFVILLNECSPEKAIEVVEDIKRTFKNEVGLSFSYGISEFSGNILESIKIADRRMYEMKRNMSRVRSEVTRRD